MNHTKSVLFDFEKLFLTWKVILFGFLHVLESSDFTSCLKTNTLLQWILLIVFVTYSIFWNIGFYTTRTVTTTNRTKTIHEEHSKWFSKIFNLYETSHENQAHFNETFCCQMSEYQNQKKRFQLKNSKYTVCSGLYVEYVCLKYLHCTTPVRCEVKSWYRTNFDENGEDFLQLAKLLDINKSMVCSIIYRHQIHGVVKRPRRDAGNVNIKQESRRKPRIYLSSYKQMPTRWTTGQAHGIHSHHLVVFTQLANCVIKFGRRSWRKKFRRD